MTPYYQDDYITLYHADCLGSISEIQEEVDALVTDPPYFKVKDDDWDNQWDKASDFLAWMGGWVDEVKPILAPHASVWVFASPAMTSSVERLLGDRFKVLNSIRWVKEAGWHQKIELEAQRRFTTPWEGLIFAEQYGADSTTKEGLWVSVHEPIRLYLNTLRVEAGMTIQEVNEAWQAMRESKGQTPGHWFSQSQWFMPTPEHYEWLQGFLGVRGREYEDLRREYEDLRRPFRISERVNNSDVWTFDPVQRYPGKHPCEKPIGMMEHIIKTSTREGHTLLDPFAGSGSTLRAAKNLGRQCIGFEIEEKYCEIAAQRLAQETLGIF